MKKLIYLLFALLFSAVLLPGEEIWEGNAGVIRRGEFESPGMYAASNSFPRNSRILVENLQNGRQVEVTVLQRINGAGNIFLLLSEEAAQSLGLPSSEVTRVEVRILSSLGVDLEGLQHDLPFNPDPDINPSAGITDYEEKIFAEEIAEEIPEIVQIEPTQPAEEPEAGPEAVETAEETRLQELAARRPQKQLFMPPREDERFILAEVMPEEPEEPAVEQPPIEEAEILAEPAEIGEEQPPTLSMAMLKEEEHPLEVDLPDPEKPAPEKPIVESFLSIRPAGEPPAEVEPDLPQFEAAVEAAEESPAPPVEPGRAVITLELTEPQPPQEEIEQAPPVSEPPTAVEETAAPEAEYLPLVEALEAKSYFLQLGAFETRSRAESLAQDLQSTYTVAVLPGRSENRIVYKVLVGPLNDDESGTLLYRFKSRGFKDAFIRSGH